MKAVHQNCLVMTTSERCYLPTWLWLWTPIVLTVVFFFYFILQHFGVVNNFYKVIQGEFGIYENLTVIFALAAIVPVVLCFKQSLLPEGRFFKVMLVIFALGCFVLAGEELSWGQHFFGWETPEALAKINKQQETNLHNLGDSMNRIRTLLSSLLFILGAILPTVRYCKYKTLHSDMSKKLWWAWPSFSSICLGYISFLITIPQKINDFELASIPYPDNFAELKECYLTLFFLFYSLSLYLRLKDKATQDE